ncbi:MAG: hypothetical protein CR992_01115 [Desulfobacterales bacterium]|nr:MAG: hypothetical protein CR992_01115 [Desulfobacterales bacterium]
MVLFTSFEFYEHPLYSAKKLSVNSQNTTTSTRPSTLSPKPEKAKKRETRQNPKSTFSQKRLQTY